LPPPPTTAQLKQAQALGLAPDALSRDHEIEPFGVWPENWDAVQLFLAAGTQWRRSAGMPTGIDYAALAWPMRSLGLRGRRAREAFAGMQIMEAEWLRRQRS
jgi:hypothetical protein